MKQPEPVGRRLIGCAEHDELVARVVHRLTEIAEQVW